MRKMVFILLVMMDIINCFGCEKVKGVWFNRITLRIEVDPIITKSNCLDYIPLNKNGSVDIRKHTLFVNRFRGVKSMDILATIKVSEKGISITSSTNQKLDKNPKIKILSNKNENFNMLKTDANAAGVCFSEEDIVEKDNFVLISKYDILYK